MSKVMIKYKHDNESFSCMGVLNDNRLIFVNNGDHLEITINEDSINIIKKNALGLINMTFKNGSILGANYDVKDMGKVMLNIKTNLLVIKKKQFLIDYEIVESNDKHIYELEYEVI